MIWSFLHFHIVKGKYKNQNLTFVEKAALTGMNLVTLHQF